MQIAPKKWLGNNVIMLCLFNFLMQVNLFSSGLESNTKKKKKRCFGGADITIAIKKVFFNLINIYVLFILIIIMLRWQIAAVKLKVLELQREL